jgi:hypothetical protein
MTAVNPTAAPAATQQVKVTPFPYGSKSPHPYAPYRGSDMTDGSPHYSIYVSSTPQLVKDTPYTDGKPHVSLQFQQVKLFEKSLQGLVTEFVQGRTNPGDLPSVFSRTKAPASLTLDRFDAAIGDALRGLALTKGTDIPESLFTDTLATRDFIDTFTGNDALVQIVRDGALTTKLIDHTKLAPEFRAALSSIL